MAVYQWGFILEPLGSVNALFKYDLLIGYPFGQEAIVIPPRPSTPVLYYEYYLRKYLADPLSAITLIAPISALPNSTVENDLTWYLRKYLSDPIN